MAMLGSTSAGKRGSLRERSLIESLDERVDAKHETRETCNMNIKAIGPTSNEEEHWQEETFQSGSIRFRKGGTIAATVLPTVEWSQLKDLHKLGEGAYADVFCATLGETKVAVKLLKEGMHKNQLAIDDLEGEMMLMCMLDHPNVLKVLSTGHREGSRFVVIELLDCSLSASLPPPSDGGAEMFQSAKRKSSLKHWTLARGLRTGVQLAAALRYLHGYGQGVRVLHRDLKPDNIGLVGDRLVLVDFGLAKVWSIQGDDDAPRPLTGETGSLRYMAPEVALSTPYSCKAEVYSFAVILWEVLAHEKPFNGVTAAQFVSRVAGAEALRPKLSPDWPDGVCSLIAQCWDVDPSKRPFFEEIHPRLESLAAAAEIAGPEVATSSGGSSAGCCALQ